MTIRENDEKCTGHGECYIYDDYNNHYYKPHPCRYECKLHQCPNYLLCQSKVPQRELNCHDNRCQSCNMSFGQNLIFIVVNEICPCCFEDSFIFVRNPDCSSGVCVLCFQQSHDDHINTLNNLNDLYKCPLCDEIHLPLWMLD